MAAVSAYAFFAVVLLALTLAGLHQPCRADPAAVRGPSPSSVSVIPSTMVLSLENHGPIAGMASALGGTLQMVTGGRDDRRVRAVLRRHLVADGRDHRLHGGWCACRQYRHATPARTFAAARGVVKLLG